MTKLAYPPVSSFLLEMAAGQDSNDQKLIEFLLEVEQTILEIQQSFDTTTEDVGGILLQTEMLLRDVVLFEGLLHSPGGEVMVQAVADVVQNCSKPCR